MIALKKKGQRDWVTEFNKLEKKGLQVSSLRRFFYINNTPRECISFADLQELNRQAQILLAKETQQNVKYFVAGIANIAKHNPDVLVTTPASASVTPGSNTSSATTMPGSGLTTGLGMSEQEQIDELNNEKNILTDDLNLWKRIGIGALVSLLLLGVLTVWLQTQASEKNKEQADHYTQKIARLEDDYQHDVKALERKLSKETSYNSNPVSKNSLKYDNNQQPNMSKATQPAHPSASTMPPVAETASTPVLANLPTEVAAPVALAIAPFYLSTPTARPDGTVTFLDRRQAQFNPSSSLYRFRLLTADESQADFWFENVPGLVSSALAYPDTYLQPACDYNSLNANAKQIVTDKPGRAILTDDVWRVVGKAAIRFV